MAFVEAYLSAIRCFVVALSHVLLEENVDDIDMHR